MQFEDYLRSNGLSMAEVARRWRVSVSTISRPCKGQRWPSTVVLVRAFEMSGGAVRLEDWIEKCRPLLESEGITTPATGNPDGKNEGNGGA